MTEEDELTSEDYPYQVPEGWEAVDVSGDHLIYENQSEEYAIELMLYDDEWQLSPSEPNPQRGGMMDVVDHWEYQEVGQAFEKINEIMEQNEL